MKGQIVEWNDTKGYGFIFAVSGERKVFFHISSVTNRGYRPKLKDSVIFDVIEDNKGRLNAENIVVQGIMASLLRYCLVLAFWLQQQHR